MIVAPTQLSIHPSVLLGSFVLHQSGHIVQRWMHACMDERGRTRPAIIKLQCLLAWIF